MPVQFDPAKRYIVQITAATSMLTDTMSGPRLVPHLFALCDDGTLWSLADEWSLVKPIPQGNDFAGSEIAEERGSR